MSEILQGDLCHMPARKQLALFRARKLSPFEVLKAQIKRADEREPVVNAFSATFFEQALQQARAAEDIWFHRPDDARALEGITVAIKDEMDVFGQPNTMGSLIYKDNVAGSDHPVAARLRAAGAIFHARTNVPEFSCAWVTHSRLHGVTRNPWNPEYTTWGSSGGSAAALACGMTTRATGSDIGGSIRGPAGACGVVGFKPPYGRVPDTPPFNLDVYCHIGPMAQNVSDCALMQNVISGHHPRDIATLRDKVILPYEHGSLAGKRILWTLDVGNEVVTDEVAAGVMRAVEALRRAGATLEEVKLGWGVEIRTACKRYSDHLLGSFLKRIVAEHPELVCDYTAYYASGADEVTADEFLASFEVAGKIYEDFGPIIEDAYAMICPAIATQTIRADQRPWERVIVQGRDCDTDYDCNAQVAFNMLSRLPVLAVPTGFGSNLLPGSVQVVARSFDDVRAFHVGTEIERACMSGVPRSGQA